MKISREQVLEMSSWGNKADLEKVKQWFPEAFETKLEFGKWYKNKFDSLFCIEKIQANYVVGYGFINGYWHNKAGFDLIVTEATPKEVKTALINEARKRGYKKGVFCEFGTAKDIREIKNDNYRYHENLRSLLIGNDVIFEDGKWSPIVLETITKSEAEKILNKKIV